jgi:phosphopantothenoylcysteine decarboxylase
MHIDLREWADLLVVAPLSANTLAKFATGLCDNLLTSVARAWNFGSTPLIKSTDHDTSTAAGAIDNKGCFYSKPIILAPAMNTSMWDHPLTQQQLQIMQSFSSNVFVVQPQSKLLACGDVGNGALAPVEDIIIEVKRCLLYRLSLSINADPKGIQG